MVRKSPSLTSYLKVRKFFEKNPNIEITGTNLRDKLQIDYYSLMIILKVLQSEKLIKKNKTKYSKKRKLWKK